MTEGAGRVPDRWHFGSIIHILLDLLYRPKPSRDALGLFLKQMPMETIKINKELVATKRKVRQAASKAEMLYQVLQDVQAVHEGVNSYLEILMNSELQLSHDDWNTMCHDVRNRSRLLAEIVDGAIELAQYGDLARLPLQDPVHVNTFCEDMMAACEHHLRNPNVELRFETALPDGLAVRTHMGYLRKLMKNLLISAMQYTDEGYIKLSAYMGEGKRQLFFRLQDTGAGIPAAMKKNVFERLPSDGDMTNTIVGVRLRIAYALAHKLGGVMFLDNLHLPGTSIVFSIAM